MAKKNLGDIISDNNSKSFMQSLNAGSTLFTIVHEDLNKTGIKLYSSRAMKITRIELVKDDDTVINVFVDFKATPYTFNKVGIVNNLKNGSFFTLSEDECKQTIIEALKEEKAKANSIVKEAMANESMVDNLIDLYKHRVEPLSPVAEEEAEVIHMTVSECHMPKLEKIL